jgi:hypothetical protein
MVAIKASLMNGVVTTGTDSALLIIRPRLQHIRAPFLSQNEGIAADSLVPDMHLLMNALALIYPLFTLSVLTNHGDLSPSAYHSHRHNRDQAHNLNQNKLMIMNRLWIVGLPYTTNTIARKC